MSTGAAREGAPARWRAFLRDHGFLAALVVGALLRAHFVFFTPGSLDVEVWDGHAATLNLRGLIPYYQGGVFQFNHPPPIAMWMKWMWKLGRGLEIPFPVLLRLPFALLDAGSLWLILRLLAGHPLQRPLALAFWLHPLAMIYSAYHGNTDSAVAFFLLASALCVVRGRAAMAGAVLGLGLWIKLPCILAAPALCLGFGGWRDRWSFAVAFLGAAAAGYLPALAVDASAVLDAVIFYSGLVIQTKSGLSAWGLQNLLPAPMSVPAGMRLAYHDVLAVLFEHNTLVCLTPILVLAWCRRGERSAEALALTLTGTYTLLYGLTSYWAFQYFAWSLPFWWIGSRTFGASASFFATLYVGGLYVWLTGDPLLLGDWDFLGKPDWPAWLRASRDLANLFFLFAGLTLLIQALHLEIGRWSRKSAG